LSEDRERIFVFLSPDHCPLHPFAINMALLRAKKNSILKESLFHLVFDTMVIGRHPYCEIVLDHGAVSREHARISQDKGRFYVEDLHSRNGTWLNGKPVERKQLLASGDVIRICDLEFIFFSDSNEHPPTESDSQISTGQQVFYNDNIRNNVHITSQVPVLRSEDTAIREKKPIGEQKYRALIDLGRDIGVAMDEMLPQLAQTLLKFFPVADCTYVFLRDEKSGKFALQGYKHRDPVEVTEKLYVSRAILEKAAATKVAILSDDISDDSWFDGNRSILNEQICSIMVTPLIDFNQNVFGVIQLDSRSTGRRFDADDLETLVNVANQVAIAYENMRHYEAMAQERAIERELAVAHKVQKGFLPIQPPKLENYGFFDYYQPAKYLGGDYFDYVMLPDGRLAVALGDVSGKGVSAALLMAKLSAEVRYSLVTEPTPADAMKRLNNVFCEERWDNRFVTFLLTLIDPALHQVTMLNAGHNPPLLYNPTLQNGQVIEIANDLGGLPLGVRPDSVYRACEFSLEPGQIVAIYSDGLTDAMNMEGHTFDLERVRKILNENGQKTVDAIGRKLIDTIREFSAKTPQADDQCLVLFGRF